MKDSRTSTPTREERTGAAQESGGVRRPGQAATSRRAERPVRGDESASGSTPGGAPYREDAEGVERVAVLGEK